MIVWDDFGGFYDHVPPASLRHDGPGPADAGADHLARTRWPGTDPDGGSIDSTVYEFSSVLRFIEDLHGLEPMTDRDAQADPLAGAFDFVVRAEPREADPPHAGLPRQLMRRRLPWSAALLLADTAPAGSGRPRRRPRGLRRGGSPTIADAPDRHRAGRRHHRGGRPRAAVHGSTFSAPLPGPRSGGQPAARRRPAARSGGARGLGRTTTGASTGSSGSTRSTEPGLVVLLLPERARQPVHGRREGGGRDADADVPRPDGDARPGPRRLRLRTRALDGRRPRRGDLRSARRAGEAHRAA